VPAKKLREAPYHAMLEQAMQLLVPGLLVTPNVRLDRPLGEGGMGSVWLADHLSLHSKVVVKFISDALVTSQEARQRFSREAAAASQVKSPHVVQTFDHGVMTDGTPYIVMEYLEGRSFGEALRESGPMASAFVVEVVKQLARALEKAHGIGIVHRDIKPDNVFLCDAGDGAVFVKLLDFGIAKAQAISEISESTRTGALMGSPHYMSPEQLMGAKTLDHRTDVWSVGVMVYEALSGLRPFDADTVGALTMRIHNEPHPKPSEVFAASVALDAWFARACSVAPADRFMSVKALAEGLAAALSLTGSGPVVSVAAYAPRASSSSFVNKTPFPVDPSDEKTQHYVPEPGLLSSRSNASLASPNNRNADTGSEGQKSWLVALALVVLAAGVGLAVCSKSIEAKIDSPARPSVTEALADPLSMPSALPIPTMPELPLPPTATVSVRKPQQGAPKGPVFIKVPSPSTAATVQH
jgi:eukaryotic-like serine/threonine-protein kinase